jgi:acetylornithine deacetylase/succinyl-diaminopimelate desuccinylase-like protein
VTAVEQVIADAIAICETPAPTGSEEARAQLVAGLFGATGLTAERDGAGNVLVRLGGPGPAVALAAHLDTVFALERIEVRRDDALLHGPGIGDNSVAVAGLLHVARSLNGARLATPLLLAATVGEEGRGDLRGAKALVAEQDCRELIALEGAMIGKLVTAAVGSVRFELSVSGPGGHSWSDRGTPSAIHVLAELITRVTALPPETSLNVGVVNGGTTVNSIAAQARAELDMRAEDEAALQRQVERLEELVGTPAALDVALTPVGRRGAGSLPADHPLLHAARRARAEAGLERADETASSTDANAALARNIPAITVGLAAGKHLHTEQEQLDTTLLEQGLQALEHLITDRCRITRPG